MNTHQNKVSQDTEKLKEIPKWARRYAESRTAPLIIFSLVFVVSFVIAFMSVYFFLRARFILGSIMAVIDIILFLYFIIAWDKHEANYFTKTGIPQSESVKQIRKFLPLPLIACVVIDVTLEQRGVLPHYLSVPVSALYVCPLLVFANWRWARGSFIGYLWAALYAGWSIAILFKVPILTFSQGGQLKPGDEMYLAAPVTGVITGIVAYIYSRYALKKLKAAAKLQESNNEHQTK